MTYAITSYSPAKSIGAEVFNLPSGSGILTFRSDGCANAQLHIPSHVAEHTASAFNRAMQAEAQQDGSFVYWTDQGAWTISLDQAMRKVWHFQNEEVTGDGDPHWLTGSANSLLAAMDEIDALIEDNACTECKALVGEENCIEVGKNEFICHDCAEQRAKDGASMQETAGDDRAHAWADNQREQR